MADAKQLARIARVRAVQLSLARAGEAAARAHAASEAALNARVAQLAAAVAPAPAAGTAVSLTAAAHYRDRLQQTAAAAAARVDRAEERAAAAAAATREADRDLKAVEKLLDREAVGAALAQMRALEEAAGAHRRLRHGPC